MPVERAAVVQHDPHLLLQPQPVIECAEGSDNPRLDAGPQVRVKTSRVIADGLHRHPQLVLVWGAGNRKRVIGKLFRRSEGKEDELLGRLQKAIGRTKEEISAEIAAL